MTCVQNISKCILIVGYVVILFGSHDSHRDRAIKYLNSNQM